MFLVRELTDHSLPEIGAFFGGRGHATVIHSCNKIERLAELSPKVRQGIDDLKVLIQNA